ncbi:MAG: hypothetical protein JSS14_21040 [Proteobacteria bacterium]|nr:hypothetical protein [Pseudomonadota bacterium]
MNAPTCCIAALLLLCAASPASASEIRPTPPGPGRAWTQPAQAGEAARLDEAGEREFVRRRWLAGSPIGARDFCASSAIVATSPGTQPPLIDCFHGSAALAELQAYGWELTDVQRTLHKYSPGFEVEVVKAVAVKKQCLNPSQGQAEAESLRSDCIEGSQGGKKRAGLFWQQPSP